MFNLGIDWADQHHDVYGIDDTGRQVTEFRVAADGEGIAKLREKLRELGLEAGGKEHLRIGIETPRLLLVDVLLNDGYTIYPLNPKAVDRYRDRYTSSGAKSDRFDAKVIANALRTDLTQFHQLQPDSPLVREIRILVKDHKRLLRSKNLFLNQLRAALKDYYPVVVDLFDSLDSANALAFLKQYPKPGSIKLKQLIRLFRQHRHPKPEQKAQEIVGRLAQAQIPVDEFTVRAKSRFVITLVEQIQALLVRLDDYQTEIEKLFEQHPDADWINSLPGSGPQNSPRLLAELGDNRDRYQNPDQMQCEAGTSPVTKSSGQMRIVVFRRACRKSFRDTMQQFSFCSMNKSVWARDLYDRLIAKNKSNPAALRAVSDKWLKIIYHLWKNRIPYDENRYLADRMRSQLRRSAVPA